MAKTLFASLLAFASLSAPDAWAVYRCESNGRVIYSDQACAEGKSIKIVDANADERQRALERAAKEKQTLQQIEKERDREESAHRRRQAKLDKASAAQSKKCRKLAMQKKWSDEDMAQATGKKADKARQSARRKAEAFEHECGGRQQPA